MSVSVIFRTFDPMKNLSTRRSIRQYSDKEVSSELLNRLMTEAGRTQTMGNLQLYSVIVTRNEEMKERLAPAHFNQPMVKQAPVVLTICADFRRTTRWCEERKAQPGYNNFLSYQNAAIDALLYTQTLCNLMDEEGLGYCYLGTTVYQPQQIIDRLPMESFVHEETYHDYTSQDIDKYYHEKENLEENRHFCEINHKETLAQIFTDIRYTKKDNEAMSATLLETLKKQGFID